MIIVVVVLSLPETTSKAAIHYFFIAAEKKTVLVLLLMLVSSVRRRKTRWVLLVVMPTTSDPNKRPIAQVEVKNTNGTTATFPATSAYPLPEALHGNLPFSMSRFWLQKKRHDLLVLLLLVCRCYVPRAYVWTSQLQLPWYEEWLRLEALELALFHPAQKK